MMNNFLICIFYLLHIALLFSLLMPVAMVMVICFEGISIKLEEEDEKRDKK